MRDTAVSTASSSSLLSGNLAAVVAGEWLAMSWEDILAHAIEGARAEAALDLRTSARNDAEWEPIASSLDVEFREDGEFHFVVDEDAQEAAELLEFGRVDSVPSPLIRKTARRAARTIGDAVTERFNRSNPLA